MLTRKSKKRGFTLVELVIVIAILALLAAIALPKFVNSREKARETAHNANVRVLKSAATTYLADKGNPAETKKWSESEGDWEKYLDEWPKNPKTEGEDYEVEIRTDGTVNVKPPAESGSEKETETGEPTE